MDWFLLVPVFVIGIFLLIIWNTISPVRFFQQVRGGRRKHKQKWHEYQNALIEEEEATLEALKKE